MITPRHDLWTVPMAVHGGPDGDARNEIRVDFSSSVNAFGPAPSLLAAIRDSVTSSSVASYPDPTSRVAREVIAEHLGVGTDELCIGAGATELILSIVQAFSAPADSVLVPAHGFGEYARAAAIVGARVVSPPPMMLGAPLESAVGAYVRAVMEHRPRIAFLCTPESPSGRAWSVEAVTEVADACRECGTLLVLDQSFDPFAVAPLGTPALRGHPATLHLRSLTKDHALAGVRLGFVVGASEMVSAVERCRMPWSVSAVAQAAAVAIHAADALAHVRRTTAVLRSEASRIRDELRVHGVDVHPTDVHYMLIRVASAPAVSREMAIRYGLRVRDCTSFGLPGHIRVAARTAEENDLLITALGELRVGDGGSHRSPPSSMDVV